jgi:integrase
MKGQIEKRGDGVYRLRWYTGRVNGKRRYGSKTLRGTKKQAEKALREILAKQDRGLAVPSPTQIPTLGDYVDTWKETVAGLRERTIEDYLDMLERHVLPSLGGVRLDAIHATRIEAEVVAPLRAKGHLRTARLAVSALSRVYRSAVKDPSLGLVGNPCLGVEVGKKPRRELRPLDPDERGRFREAIKGTEHEHLWLMMMLTGLGPGEALGLGWEHIDLDTGTLRVVRTLDCKARRLIDDTKRPSRKRVVPLVPELHQTLRERWMATGRPVRGLVFSNPKGEPLDLDNLRTRHFYGALEKAEIKRRVRIYDLRHGFGTAGLEAGLDAKDVATLMGHSSTRTTQDIYQHVSDQRKREAAERIAERLGGH